MSKFNQQFATQHLREEFDSNIMFTIHNDEANSIFGNLVSLGAIDNLAPEEADYLELSDSDWQQLQQRLDDAGIYFDDAVTQMTDYMKHQKNPNYYEKQHKKRGKNDYFSRRDMYEDGSATGGEAFKPGLDVPAKKYKATYTETKNIPKDWKESPSIPNRPSTGGYIYKQLFESDDLLNENYSQFKNKTKTRGTSDQFHQAVREVKKRVEEINKLFEYVGKLKEELSESEGGLKYKMHTEKALGKIKNMVFELNKSIRKFK
jgi:hypothetical protein